MTKNIVILGGGTGGTLVANRAKKVLHDLDVAITVIDQDNEHLYQPGLLFVPFGLKAPESLVRNRKNQLKRGINFLKAEVVSVDTASNRVHLASGDSISYDVLVISTGNTLQIEETEGLSGSGWGKNVFTFYTLEGADALNRALAKFSEGKLVVDIIDVPIKCPVAPLEFCQLADWYFKQKGIRDQIEITLVTPLDGAFTKPVCNRELSGLLRSKGIEVITEFNTGQVDGVSKKLVSYDGREVAYDLAVVVPLHGGADFVGRSPGLGDELNFVTVDEFTLQAKVAPNVFAIGDAPNLPTSKAGSVAHFAGEIVVENIGHYLQGEPLSALFDGHTNCFIESGFHKALLIDFNYETEPLPGHYPSAIGLPLLRESKLNHIGKLLFEKLYWYGILPGRNIPGIKSLMPRMGKRFENQEKGS